MSTAVSQPGQQSLSDLAILATNSYELIVSLQDASGAYPASPTFSAYRGYSWFRDGAFIADGVSAIGGAESASRFFDWCSRTLLAQEAHIGVIVAAQAAGKPVTDAEMLATRFTFAGEPGDDEWWDFQLDGYGTWLWAVAAHAERHGLDLSRWRRAIELTVDYLCSSWSRPCFDWWEENADQVHVSTLGCIRAGLTAVLPVLDEARRSVAAAASETIAVTVAERGLSDGHLAKWLGSQEIDASLLAAVYPLSAFPASTSVGARTIEAVDARLNFDGGVHRYLKDTFYGGGQWPLLSCMLGLAFAASGRADRALEQLNWAAGALTPDGFLPEQVGDHLLDESMRQEWIDRWGTVATPLLWSHAMYIRLAVELEIATEVAE